MKVTSEELILDLIEKTKQTLNDTEQFKQSTIKNLNWKIDPDSWSALECIEHLNLYGDFYLPEITNKLQNAKKDTASHFKSGLLGNYFAKSLLPKKQLNKMKTFKNKNPIGSKLDISTIDRFINQQKKTLELLDKARQVNLNKVKTGISISKFITLRLGDTFRVLIYHNQRHLVQAKKAIHLYTI